MAINFVVIAPYEHIKEIPNTVEEMHGISLQLLQEKKENFPTT